MQKLKIIEKEGSSTTKQPKRSRDMIRSYSAVDQIKRRRIMEFDIFEGNMERLREKNEKDGEKVR